jgi:hypothetical protein
MTFGEPEQKYDDAGHGTPSSIDHVRQRGESVCCVLPCPERNGDAIVRESPAERNGHALPCDGRTVRGGAERGSAGDGSAME